MGSRKDRPAGKDNHGIPTFAQLVQESMTAGMRRRAAEAHARKILGSYDLIVIDTTTGEWRYDTGGPSVFDFDTSPPNKRQKGKAGP